MLNEKVQLRKINVACVLFVQYNFTLYYLPLPPTSFLCVDVCTHSFVLNILFQIFRIGIDSKTDYK